MSAMEVTNELREGLVPGRRLSLYRPDEWPEVLTTGQVAQLLGLANSSVRGMIERGQLDAVLVGSHYRVAAESVWGMVPPVIRASWPEGRWKRTVDDGNECPDA